MDDIHLTLTIEETNQILDALGHQPYMAVFQLITKIQQQAQMQLQQAAHGSPANHQPGAPLDDAAAPDATG